MSEQEMNSYRFTSGQEPTDDMLSQLITKNPAARGRVAGFFDITKVGFISRGRLRSCRCELCPWGFRIGDGDGGHSLRFRVRGTGSQG